VKGWKYAKIETAKDNVSSGVWAGLPLSPPSPLNQSGNQVYAQEAIDLFSHLQIH
jgi:hypothetical protein